MTERPFFAELNEALRGLPPEQRDEILQDFREHFEAGRALTLAGIGILLVTGLVYITRALARLFVAYLRFNMRMVVGGMSYAGR